jgi:flagellar biosynthesis chaperone FliJ
MAKYVLEDMLRVRNLRKDTAEKNLKQAQRLVDEAKENIAKAEKELADFKIFIEKETERLYKKIMKQMVKKGSVDELHYAVKALKSKLLTYEQNVETARENLIKAEKNFEEKRELLQEASRNVEKIKSHKDEWMTQALKEEELVADKEMEEFSKSKMQKD